MEFIAPMLILITIALVIGSIFRSHFVNRRLRESARAYADLQAKLIDKFGDAGAVVSYLESDAGRQLASGADSRAGAPHTRILDTLHTGILVLLGGVGLTAASGTSDPQVHEVLRAFGLIGIILGAGFLASALISWMLLRRWGQLPGKDRHEASSDLG